MIGMVFPCIRVKLCWGGCSIWRLIWQDCDGAKDALMVMLWKPKVVPCMKVDHVEGESINLINTSQVVPGESFPTNTEIGKANQINTFKQVYPKDNNFELRCFLQILSAMLLNKTLTKNSSSKTGLEWAAQSCVLWRDLSTKRSQCRQGENLFLWSRSSAPLFKALLLPSRQGENNSHELFVPLF